MDVRCLSCMEPWDAYGLLHDVPSEEGWRFGSSRLVVLRCPCCPEDAEPDPHTVKAVEEIAAMLGDDMDGLAAELSDLTEML